MTGRLAPQPFPYQGSKRSLAGAVLRHLPQDTAAVVEPFAGSAALSIAARHAGLAGAGVINDVNAPLVGLWREILDDPVALADDYEARWRASLPDPRAYFEEVRAGFNADPDPGALLYLLHRIVKGAIRYSRGGSFNQAADHRRLGARPERVRDRLDRTSRVMHGTEVRCGSYEPLLVGAGRRDLVYLDPPYQGVTLADRRYLAGLARGDLEGALRAANDNGVSYLVSYDAIREDGRYGERLDASLGLTHVHLDAGRSAQSTLGGGTERTVESLYLSPALVERLASRREK